MKVYSNFIKKFKCVIVLLILMLMLVYNVMPSFAIGVTGEDPITGGNEGSSDSTKLPRVEMKVKIKKDGEISKILVECWLEQAVNLEGIEMVFTYNTNKLRPSNITDEELEQIQYIDDATALNNRGKNTEILKKSFEFDNGIDPNLLGIDIFENRGKEGAQEAVSFVISKPTMQTADGIDATNKTLLGTFSFDKIDDSKIESTDFVAKRILVSCDEGWPEQTYPLENEESEKILEFVYEMYGSISGTIKTKYYKVDGTFKEVGKNLATIKIFEKNSVLAIDWSLTGNNYKNIISNLPEPLITYEIEEKDSGKFLIETIPLGEYVILIDKNNYLDYVITNVIIDSGKNIKLDDLIGDIEVIPGDTNNDGRITLTDKTTFDTAYKGKNKELDLNDDKKVTLGDKTVFDTVYKLKPSKTVISL